MLLLALQVRQETALGEVPPALGVEAAVLPPTLLAHQVLVGTAAPVSVL